MKAAYIEQLGPPGHIRYGELPPPVVGERDVLVKVAATAAAVYRGPRSDRGGGRDRA
jgi:NADPH:quinone reductase-like Zn-dependent oxidoreductase